jgi:OOP family OmpA-OmpF porin
MVDEYWGMKIDYAHDGIDDNGTKGSLGSLYDRVSAQAVYNIGRTFNLPNLTGGNVNFLLHSGIGYSRLNPYESTTYDNMVNFIIGGTAQLYISESLAFTGDLSGILNFRQNSTFGSKYMEGNYTGKMITASIGLTYYIGRNKNTADFR